MSDDEIAKLAAYLKSDCDCRFFATDKPSQAATEEFQVFRNSLGTFYPKYVDQFIQVVNNRDLVSSEVRKTRSALRKLLESRKLPKCQMYAMCNYVLLCVGAVQARSQAENFIERRFAAADKAKSTRSELEKLQKALEAEEMTATRMYGFPALNNELRSITELMSACLTAIDEIQKVRKHFFSIELIIKGNAVLRRLARKFYLNPKHPDISRATGADTALILPFLHEAIADSPLSDSIAILYKENNTQRDKLRFPEEKTQAKLNEMVERFNKIIPNFCERIEIENLQDMHKTPIEVAISPPCGEILMLAKFHSECVRSGNIQGFIDTFEAILKMMKDALSS